MKYGVALLLLLSACVQAEPANLSHDIAKVKASVLELNRALYEVESDLLSPATTQIAFYVSLRAGTSFDLRSIEVRAGNLAPVHHIYTERQVETLRMGAVQPLSSLNIGPGKHELKARILGVDQRGETVQLDVAQSIEKSSAPLLLEFVINAQNDYPNALVRAW